MSWIHIIYKIQVCIAEAIHKVNRRIIYSLQLTNFDVWTGGRAENWAAIEMKSVITFSVLEFVIFDEMKYMFKPKPNLNLHYIPFEQRQMQKPVVQIASVFVVVYAQVLINMIHTLMLMQRSNLYHNVRLLLTPKH